MPGLLSPNYDLSEDSAHPDRNLCITLPTDTAKMTSFVVCDVCGQSLPSVPPTVAYRGGQTQAIRYNHQLFRRDFVRARQAPPRIREMARMAEEKEKSKERQGRSKVSETDFDTAG